MIKKIGNFISKQSSRIFSSLYKIVFDLLVFTLVALGLTLFFGAVTHLIFYIIWMFSGLDISDSFMSSLASKSTAGVWTILFCYTFSVGLFGICSFGILVVIIDLALKASKIIKKDWRES